MSYDGQKGIVESYVPGRLRVRMPPEKREDEAFAHFSGMIERLSGVRSISVNRKTGSVLVEFDPEALAVEEVNSLARVAGIIGEIGEIIGQAEGEEDNIAWNELSIAAKRLQKAFWKANGSVRRATNGLVDLRLLIPAALLMLGIARAVATRKNPPTPWYALFWYAYSIFMHWQDPTKHMPHAGSLAGGK